MGCSQAAGRRTGEKPAEAEARWVGAALQGPGAPGLRTDLRSARLAQRGAWSGATRKEASGSGEGDTRAAGRGHSEASCRRVQAHGAPFPTQ